MTGAGTTGSGALTVVDHLGGGADRLDDWTGALTRLDDLDGRADGLDRRGLADGHRGDRGLLDRAHVIGPRRAVPPAPSAGVGRIVVPAAAGSVMSVVDTVRPPVFPCQERLRIPRAACAAPLRGRMSTHSGGARVGMTWRHSQNFSPPETPAASCWRSSRSLVAGLLAALAVHLRPRPRRARCAR